jgi:hypothetical protein
MTTITVTLKDFRGGYAVTLPDRRVIGWIDEQSNFARNPKICASDDPVVYGFRTSFCHGGYKVDIYLTTLLTLQHGLRLTYNPEPTDGEKFTGDVFVGLN